MNMERRTALTVLAILILAATQLVAQQQISGDFDVRASVVSNCRLLLTPLDFGTYDPLGAHQSANLETTARMTLTCTPLSQVTVDLDQGLHPTFSSQAALRAMTSAEAQLAYQVFRDAARTQTWGKGADALQFFSRRA